MDNESMLFEIKRVKQKNIKFVIKRAMGCGALSGADEVFKPQLQFRKLKPIHKSQQTQIWTCENQNKEKFSIKVFKKIYIHQENQSMLTNFQLEINRLLALAHSTETQKSQYEDARKHLVPYHRAWKDENGNLCLIMQYIEQSSLGDEVKGKLPGMFNEVMIAKLTQQILQSIKFLRSHGSIFCNFKPTNAFLSKDRQNILLTDYYNLQQYFKLSQNNIFRNPIYSAPENVLFNQYFQGTDVWRIGCFIVEMLTCIKPWYKETMNNEKIIQNLKGLVRPPLPDKLSKQCKYFLEKCFETDHNRRTTLEELLYHDFITFNAGKSQKIPKTNDRISYERQNTTVQQIASYNLQIQLIDSPRLMQKKTSGKRKQISIPATQRTQLSPPLQSTKKMHMKKPSANFIPQTHKEYETAKAIISENDENLEKSTVQMKHSRNFRSKRIKTQGVDTKPMDASYVSPYSREKKSKDFLQLLNRKKAISIANPYDSPTAHDYSVSKNVSQTANYRLNKSKKKIPTNQITLNNQVISFPENGSTKYWPSPQISAPFNYLQTAEKLNKVMREIEQQGGEMYYKKPLKLLKQRMKGKHTLRTQTSITLQDSRALLQKSQQEIQQIKLDRSNNNIPSEDQTHQNQTQMSKISYQTSHQNQVIQTLTSKALKERFQTQKKMLMKQREQQKVKWQKQLREGRQFIKNQFNKRYHVSSNSSKMVEYYQH